MDDEFGGKTAPRSDTCEPAAHTSHDLPTPPAGRRRTHVPGGDIRPASSEHNDAPPEGVGP